MAMAAGVERVRVQCRRILTPCGTESQEHEYREPAACGGEAAEPE